MAENDALIELGKLREFLCYDPLSGQFIWLCHRGRSKYGKAAGSIQTKNGKKYWFISIGGRAYRAHRLAWFYMTGQWPEEIDHIDGDGLNNSWANLRTATRSQNMANARKQKNNSTGYKGVTFNRRTRKFTAKIKSGSRQKYLGEFFTAKDAHVAYCAAAKKQFGEFARAA
jgi:hypothetical protein